MILLRMGLYWVGSRATLWNDRFMTTDSRFEAAVCVNLLIFMVDNSIVSTVGGECARSAQGAQCNFSSIVEVKCWSDSEYRVL